MSNYEKVCFHGNDEVFFEVVEFNRDVFDIITDFDGESHIFWHLDLKRKYDINTDYHEIIDGTRNIGLMHLPRGEADRLRRIVSDLVDQEALFVACNSNNTDDIYESKRYNTLLSYYNSIRVVGSWSRKLQKYLSTKLYY